jgi:D-mannonate dehydratase
MSLSEVKPRFSPGLILALAAFMLVLSGLALWFLGRGEHLESAFVRGSQKAQLVSRMRAELYAAADAEKSAVMAETDAASQDNAKRAQAAADQVAATLKEFKALPAGNAEETTQLRRFEDAFAEYRKVDEEVLALAVQNTNLKAFALSFGPAAEALAKMEQALKPVIDAGGKGGKTAAALLASRAYVEALRIQTLHAPHITERADARMDALEKRMAESDKLVRADLAGLGASGVQALAAYDEFQKITTEIVRLSRLNTNVRSLDLSLDRKVKVLAQCDEALGALAKAVSEGLAKGTR